MNIDPTSTYDKIYARFNKGQAPKPTTSVIKGTLRGIPNGIMWSTTCAISTLFLSFIPAFVMTNGSTGGDYFTGMVVVVWAHTNMIAWPVCLLAGPMLGARKVILHRNALIASIPKKP